MTDKINVLFNRLSVTRGVLFSEWRIERVASAEAAYDRAVDAIRRVSFRHWNDYCLAFGLHCEHTGQDLFTGAAKLG